MAEPVIPQPRGRLWVRILLIASLSLNLLVVGVVAGAWFRYGGHGPGLVRPAATGSVYYREMHPEIRTEMRGELRRVLKGVAYDRAAVSGQMAAAIRADPFDPDRLNALFDKQAEATGVRQSAMRDIWVARLSEMNADDRAAYADRVEEALRHHRQMRHRPKD
jgi:uncharacterized membrane protein